MHRKPSGEFHSLRHLDALRFSAPFLTHRSTLPSSLVERSSRAGPSALPPSSQRVSNPVPFRLLREFFIPHLVNFVFPSNTVVVRLPFNPQSRLREYLPPERSGNVANGLLSSEFVSKNLTFRQADFQFTFGAVSALKMAFFGPANAWTQPPTN